MVIKLILKYKYSSLVENYIYFNLERLRLHKEKDKQINYYLLVGLNLTIKITKEVYNYLLEILSSEFKYLEINILDDRIESCKQVITKVKEK